MLLRFVKRLVAAGGSRTRRRVHTRVLKAPGALRLTRGAASKHPARADSRHCRGFLSAAANSNSDGLKVVIVGGVAGGATAAARAKRLNDNLQVTVVERSPDVSFANCGLPYYIGGEITDRSRLALQTPASLSAALGITVKTETEATHINREEKTVTVRSVAGKGPGHQEDLPYDVLLLSPGASPLRPAAIPGIDHPRVLTLRNLQDMDRIHNEVQLPHCSRVVVVGGGFIGLEVAEQLHRLGKRVHVVERQPAVLPQADVEMGEFLHAPLLEMGFDLSVGDGVAGFEQHTDGGVAVRLESGKITVGDLVILCMGVKPDSFLARDAGLQLNDKGFIVVNDYMQTDDSSIYAVGDAVETRDAVFPDRRITVALGNVANMQARIAADMFTLGKSIAYPGSLGTSIVRVKDIVLALTGWTERRLLEAGIPHAKTTVTDNHHASYYPGALPVSMKLLFCPDTGRVLGAQAVGMEGVDKRIDVVAATIMRGGTIEDLSVVQLSYSPPFGSARDVVNVAGMSARNIQEGLVRPGYKLFEEGVQLIDVRPPEIAALHPVANSINIPYSEAEARAHELSPDQSYRTLCAMGKTSYFAARHFMQAGLDVTTLTGGLRVHQKHEAVPDMGALTTPFHSRESRATDVVELDCQGLACPGPLMKLKSAVDAMKPHTKLRVLATDPGFRGDVQAFAKSKGLSITSLQAEKGVIVAELEQDASFHAAASVRAPTQTSQVPEARKGASIVVFNGEFDKVLAALVIANGAVAMGGQATIFFTFWGLNALRHPDRTGSSKKPLIDAAMGKLLAKGLDQLPLSHFNFGGLGREMTKMQMKHKNLPEIHGLLESAIASGGVRLVACTMSMDAFGITHEEMIDGVELGGVAEFLGSAERTGTNLFI